MNIRTRNVAGEIGQRHRAVAQKEFEMPGEMGADSCLLRQNRQRGLRVLGITADSSIDWMRCWRLTALEL